LQVELKTEIDPKTFNGQKLREESTDRSRTSSNVEFDAAQLRIVRVFCAGAMTCEPLEAVVQVVDLGCHGHVGPRSRFGERHPLPPFSHRPALSR
jgi:hypothetical protein